MFRLVESIGQSKRRNCEDESIVAMMCIGKKGGACGSPAFFPSYRQLPGWSVLSRVMFMDTHRIRDVMWVCPITICGCP